MWLVLRVWSSELQSNPGVLVRGAGTTDDELCCRAEPRLVGSVQMRCLGGSKWFGGLSVLFMVLWAVLNILLRGGRGVAMTSQPGT